MKPDRIFVELHDGDDIALVDADQVVAVVGHGNSTVYFHPFTEGFVVDETPREVLQLIVATYERLADL